jgi:type III secretory pathway component EscR
MQMLKKNKKGVWNAMYAWAGGVLAVVVLIVMTFFILDIFSGGANPIFTANTYAANATTSFKVGLSNAVQQVPNAGKIAGVAVIISTFVLIGVGGYMGYNKVRG